MKLKDAVRLAQTYVKPQHARRFADHMVPHVIRPAQILWNKLLGAIFGVLAFIGYNHAYSRRINPASVGMGIFFGSVMLVVCIGSFLRVRRLSRVQRQLPVK